MPKYEFKITTVEKFTMNCADYDHASRLFQGMCATRRNVRPDAEVSGYIEAIENPETNQREAK